MTPNQFPPIITTLRARAAVATGIWVFLMSALALSVADYLHYFRVANGVDPRPIALAELLLVIAACCTPAIASPQLWSWERSGSRWDLHFVSAGLVMSAILVLAATPKLGELAGSAVASSPRTMFVNTVTFASIAVVSCIWLGRRIGPLTAVTGYLCGIGVQALEVSWPIPFQGSELGGIQFVTGASVVVIATACLAATLGRTQRTLDL
jgi:hypothetical protein